jgi:hypothetical protein
MPDLFSFDEVPNQPRPRWFVRRGEITFKDRGFSNKGGASEWIASLGRRLDTQAGFVFFLRGENVMMEIVDKDGVRAIP